MSRSKGSNSAVSLNCPGSAAPTIFRDSGLATDDAGYLQVDDWLRSVADHAIFGAGDAISLRHHPETAKAGVYAVHEGPILCENLAAALRGEHPKSAYQPQPKFLALLNTGDGRAIACYGKFALTGRWAMRWKDRIDRAFMERFRNISRTSGER
jgi:selenide,water dikinase